MISILHLSSLAAAFNIIDSARKKMYKNGLDQWHENYPNLEVVKNDIQAECLFGYFQHKVLAGIVTLNTIQDEQYANIKWKYNEGETGVIHRLAVHPDFQGKGIAKQLIRFSENYFSKKGFRQIRLDAYTANPSALGLYDKLGYETSGKLWFPRRAKAFQLFEKSLIL